MDNNKVKLIKITEIKDTPEEHICPYLAEINGDYITLCTCSDEEAYECTQDI